MDIDLTGAQTAAFLLAEANGERSRALFVVPADTPAMKAGTIVSAAGIPAATAAAAVGVLYAPTFESDEAQKATVVARDAEVHGEQLAWPEGTNAATKTAYSEQLATVGIVVRWTQRPAGLTNDMGLDDDLPIPPADP